MGEVNLTVSLTDKKELARSTLFFKKGGKLDINKDMLEDDRIRRRLQQEGGRRLRQTLIDKTEYVLIAVDDTGVGINEKVSKGIFSEFQQSDTTDVRAFGGLGLGLSLAFKMTKEVLHGHLWLEASEPGQGSQFLLCFPALRFSEKGGAVGRPKGGKKGSTIKKQKEPIELSDRAASAAAAPSWWCKKVLLIIRADVLSECMVYYLSTLGVKDVTVVKNSDDALSLAQTDPPAVFDLVLVDMVFEAIPGNMIVSGVKDSAIEALDVIIEGGEMQQVQAVKPNTTALMPNQDDGVDPSTWAGLSGLEVVKRFKKLSPSTKAYGLLRPQAARFKVDKGRSAISAQLDHLHTKLIEEDSKNGVDTFTYFLEKPVTRRALEAVLSEEPQKQAPVNLNMKKKKKKKKKQKIGELSILLLCLCILSFMLAFFGVFC